MLAALGLPRKASTENVPIGGGRGFPRDAASRARMVAEIVGLGAGASRAETLIDRYGARALLVARRCAEGADRPLISAPDYSTAELAFLFESERVARLQDALFRRTDIALSCRLTPAVAAEVAAVGAATLGWGPERVARELSDVADIAWRRHCVAEFKPVPSAPGAGNVV